MENLKKMCVEEKHCKRYIVDKMYKFIAKNQRNKKFFKSKFTLKHKKTSKVISNL